MERTIINKIKNYMYLKSLKVRKHNTLLWLRMQESLEGEQCGLPHCLPLEQETCKWPVSSSMPRRICNRGKCTVGTKNLGITQHFMTLQGSSFSSPFFYPLALETKRFEMVRVPYEKGNCFYLVNVNRYPNIKFSKNYIATTTPPQNNNPIPLPELSHTK